MKKIIITRYVKLNNASMLLHYAQSDKKAIQNTLVAGQKTKKPRVNLDEYNTFH